MGDIDPLTERRSSPRHDVALTVTFGGGTGLTRDLSAAGVFFLTEMPFQVGRRVRLDVKLDQWDADRPVDLSCRGRVCRVEAVTGEGGEQNGIAVELEAFGVSIPSHPGEPVERLSGHIRDRNAVVSVRGSQPGRGPMR